MIETYIKLKMFFEYELPLILLCVGIIVLVTVFVIAKIIEAQEKRQKKMNDKYWNEGEEHGQRKAD